MAIETAAEKTQPTDAGASEFVAADFILLDAAAPARLDHLPGNQLPSPIHASRRGKDTDHCKKYIPCNILQGIHCEEYIARNTLQGIYSKEYIARCKQCIANNRIFLAMS